MIDESRYPLHGGMVAFVNFLIGFIAVGVAALELLPSLGGPGMPPQVKVVALVGLWGLSAILLGLILRRKATLMLLMVAWVWLTPFFMLVIWAYTGFDFGIEELHV